MKNSRSGFCFSHTDAALTLKLEEDQVNTLYISDDFTADMLKLAIFRMKETLLKQHKDVVKRFY